MAVYDLYSKRQKRQLGEIEIYTYDPIPQKLRVQILAIIEDVLGTDKREGYAKSIYTILKKTLCREYGFLELIESKYELTDKEQIAEFLLNHSTTEQFIDLVDLTFNVINNNIKSDYEYYTFMTTSSLNPEEAIEELNIRFRENGIGFYFDGTTCIKIDSTYIHSEITLNTLNLLSNPKFKGANQEYLNAHLHYREGRNKECLTDCLKAFESTLKIICLEKEWKFDKKDTSKNLINICFENEVIPRYTQEQFESLQKLLISGIPTIRNNVSGHGQGQIPQNVDDQITRYGLNLVGANIIFLIEQSKLI
jgi:hypothetical protein